MTTPDKRNPNVMGIGVWMIIPTLGLFVPLIVLIMSAMQAELKLNYTMMYWMIGLSMAGLYGILMRLVSIGYTYVWEYRALVKYLRERGLQNFVDEAQKIRSLK